MKELLVAVLATLPALPLSAGEAPQLMCADVEGVPPPKERGVYMHIYNGDCATARYFYARGYVWHCRRMKRVVNNAIGCNNVPQLEQMHIQRVADEVCKVDTEMQRVSELPDPEDACRETM